MFEEQDDDDGDMKLKFEAIFMEVEVSLQVLKQPTQDFLLFFRNFF